MNDKQFMAWCARTLALGVILSHTQDPRETEWMTVSDYDVRVERSSADARYIAKVRDVSHRFAPSTLVWSEGRTEAEACDGLIVELLRRIDQARREHVAKTCIRCA